MAGTTGPSTSDAASAIQQAAQHEGVPVEILAGIYGRESTFGTAYAHGGTTYGFFGLTSPGLWQPSFSFQQDAAVAAQTLSKLYKTYGDWNTAVSKYSGGSYNADQAKATAAGNKSLLTAIGNAALATPSGSTPGVTPGPQSPAGAVTGALSGINAVGSALSSVASWVTNGAMWLRVLEAIGAVLLLALGLHALAGQSSSVGDQARKVKTKIRVVPV